MTAESYSDAGIGRRMFTKRVPATSVSPTYKLTLPSELVSESLSHLVDREFSVTDAQEERLYTVTILPRRNKEKYEYTLQGWRAFAEAQSVRTGDMLEFGLLGFDRLQITVRKRSPSEHFTVLGAAELAQARDASTSSNDERHFLQASRHPGASVSQPLADAELLYSHTPATEQLDRLLPTGHGHIDILELGHDPRDEVLSPGRQVAPMASSTADALRPRQGSGVVQYGSNQSFRHSSESDTMAFPSPEDPMWIPDTIAGNTLQATASKRQRRQAGFGYDDLQAGSPLLDSPIVTLPSRGQTTAPSGAQAIPRISLTGQTRVRPTGVDVGSASNAELQQELSRSFAREGRLQQEFGTLLRAWRMAGVTVDRHTSEGVDLSRALCAIADRLGAVDPGPTRDLALVQAELRHRARNLVEVLWNMRETFHQYDPTTRDRARFPQG